MSLDFNVKKYGSIGDGKQKDTHCIQQAVDECADNGGGTVYFPPGIYLSGQITMRDNVTLHIDAGAEILGSTDKEDYTLHNASPDCLDQLSHYGLICGTNRKNISIQGRGCIRAQDKCFWVIKDKLDKDKAKIWYLPKEKKWRPMTLLFDSCENIKIEDITIKDSPCYGACIVDCKHLYIKGIKILSDIHGPNTDGVHISSSQDVIISDSHFQTGDDSIAIDGNGSYISDGTVITNCTFNTIINAIRIFTGLAVNESQTIDQDKIGVRNVSFGNCSIINATDVINVVAEYGTIENLTFSNISANCGYKGTAIYLQHLGDKGKLKNVSINNLVVNGNGACTVLGDKKPIENIRISNYSVTIEPKEKVYGLNVPENLQTYASHHDMPYGFYLRNVSNVKLNNVSLRWDIKKDGNWGSALTCKNSEGIELNGFSAKEPDGVKNPVVLLDNVDGVFLHGIKAIKGTGTFLKLKGEKTKQITVMNSDLSEAENGIRFDKDIDHSSVFLSGNRDK